MSYKTKLWYSERVLIDLRADLRNRDEKIDQREVILKLDDVVNNLAADGVFENWKMGFYDSQDEQFLTRYEWLTITDVAKSPSFVPFPLNYAAIARQGGIHEVYFKNDPTQPKKKYFGQVIITSRKDRALYRFNMAGNLEGRLSCYPQGGNLVFDRPLVGSTYGQVGLALIIRDSSVLGDTDPYPIPGDKEGLVIETVVNWFRARMNGPVEMVKDDNPKS